MILTSTCQNSNSNKFLKLTTDLISQLRKDLNQSELLTFLTIKSIAPYGSKTIDVDLLSETLLLSKQTIWRNLRKLKKLGFIKLQRKVNHEITEIALTEGESNTLSKQKIDSEKLVIKNESESINFESKNIRGESFNTGNYCQNQLSESPNTLIDLKDSIIENYESKLKEIQGEKINESNQKLNQELQITNEASDSIQIETIEELSTPCSANEVETEYNPESHKDYESVILYLANYYYQNFPENTASITVGKIKAIKHIKKSRENFDNALKNYLRSNKSPYPDYSGIAEKKEEIPVNPRALELLSNFVKGLRNNQKFT